MSLPVNQDSTKIIANILPWAEFISAKALNDSTSEYSFVAPGYIALLGEAFLRNGMVSFTTSLLN